MYFQSSIAFNVNPNVYLDFIAMWTRAFGLVVCFNVSSEGCTCLCRLKSCNYISGGHSCQIYTGRLLPCKLYNQLWLSGCFNDLCDVSFSVGLHFEV